MFRFFQLVVRDLQAEVAEDEPATSPPAAEAVAIASCRGRFECVVVGGSAIQPVHRDRAEFRIRTEQRSTRHRPGIQPLAGDEPGKRIRERDVQVAGVPAEARDRLVVLGPRYDIEIAAHT